MNLLIEDGFMNCMMEKQQLVSNPSNDVKSISVEAGSYARSIGGFHQPQLFLME